jgi:hypothetical protein
METGFIPFYIGTEVPMNTVSPLTVEIHGLSFFFKNSALWSEITKHMHSITDKDHQANNKIFNSWKSVKKAQSHPIQKHKFMNEIGIFCTFCDIMKIYRYKLREIN